MLDLDYTATPKGQMIYTWMPHRNHGQQLFPYPSATRWIHAMQRARAEGYAHASAPIAAQPVSRIAQKASDPMVGKVNTNSAIHWVLP